jgi:ABC-type sulfate/molybdate transport systems ATPase subunit
VIAVHELRRRFGSFGLWIDSLEVPAGAYAVCLGPSGAGKSLLLKLLAGIHRPDSGRVEIDGRDVTGEPAERRRVGLVFQEASLFPHYSVAGNIGYGLGASRTPRAERGARIQQLVRDLRLERLLDQPVPALSGGEAQKVALARALATDPRVLLLDEPFNQVDQHARAGLQEMLKKVHADRSLTCLHVTHDRQEALELGDWIALMLGGRILQSGPRAEVLTRPVCAFAARFLGLPDMTAAIPDGCDQSCLIANGRCILWAGDA